MATAAARDRTKHKRDVLVLHGPGEHGGAVHTCEPRRHRSVVFPFGMSSRFAVEIPGDAVAVGEELSRGAEGVVCKAVYGGQQVCVKVPGEG